MPIAERFPILIVTPDAVKRRSGAYCVRREFLAEKVTLLPTQTLWQADR